MNLVKSHLYREHSSQKTLEALKGVYVPFWMYDYDSDVAYEAIGTKVRSWTSGDKRYTETSYFDVGRRLHVNYEGIPVDASISHGGWNHGSHGAVQLQRAHAA